MQISTSRKTIDDTIDASWMPASSMCNARDISHSPTQINTYPADSAAVPVHGTLWVIVHLERLEMVCIHDEVMMRAAD